MLFTYYLHNSYFLHLTYITHFLHLIYITHAYFLKHIKFSFKKHIKNSFVYINMINNYYQKHKKKTPERGT